MFNPYDREDWEERAAILEYDGGLSRAEAEAQATREIQARQQARKEQGS